jgi:hypothetical protein
MSEKQRKRPQPATIIAFVALLVALGVTAIAQHRDRPHKVRLGKNSVGTRQLKSRAVRTGKIANNAVTGAKVAKGTLTGDDIKIDQLPSVPNAKEADHAKTADALVDTSNANEKHSAGCPGGSTLIRGLCFDLALNPVVQGVKAAANACAAKGGYLPTVMELYSVRNVINLGTGVPPNYAIADAYFSNTFGTNYRSLTVDGAGKIAQFDDVDNGSTQFICVYELIR